MPYKFVKSAALIAGENHRVGDPRVAQWTPNTAVQEAALAWAVRGAVDWYKRGQQEPPMTDSMVKARDEWRGSNDKIGQWWQESIMDDPESFITLDDLYTSYAAQMRRSGQGMDSKRSFLAMLEQHEVYAQSGAERVRGRHKAYTRSMPAQAEDDEFYRPRSTAIPTVATFVRGVRFRTLDDQRDSEMSTDDRKAAILRSIQAQLMAEGLTLNDLTATAATPNEEEADALDADDLVF
ncbi:hypothetical protein [Gulosibacter sp. 10]|uniref:hypothetical protein n=1 Tax=Gulosibacter sp. 10 TaxID=1255570 RepID=UPI00097EE0A8|nr:hypothetical protein [Gulosibacter sp. 10]SJM69651.1 hypothetical protein FM112_14360 [Gulosibacter sp. 10]